jgi:hypothetical protein
VKNRPTFIYEGLKLRKKQKFGLFNFFCLYTAQKIVLFHTSIFYLLLLNPVAKKKKLFLRWNNTGGVFTPLPCNPKLHLSSFITSIDTLSENDVAIPIIVCPGSRMHHVYCGMSVSTCKGGGGRYGTTLQTGKSRVRFPMVSLEFFSYINFPVALWPWGRLSF